MIVYALFGYPGTLTFLRRLAVRCMRVTFTELHETEGFFGQESIAVGIGAFPKHLIYSYDLKKKIVLFPFEWKTENGKWNYERGFRDSSFYQFSFSDFCHTEVLRKSV